ncbi:hypothetical protein FB567DRAFT_121907 [Paraphoma chrysanthemicola]|uniref:Uncharacterized protein n=1 Tax=Paraphoma chrysanthemicola TaxID=798071 RepID=A0A8K0R0J5_9PLEO|nr:hypothetical protein FB567DRAFT_121907 [Paraphoma chrysanthemicola]
MPPKAQSNVLRGRGRPKRSAAPEPAPAPAPSSAPVADAPKKRGRAAKAEPVEPPAEAPKKRGRPAKASGGELAADYPVKRARRSLAAVAPAPVVEAAPSPKKRAGRPPKNSVAQPPVPAPTPKKRMGRPRQADVAAAAAQETSETPRRRGRPAKNVSADVLNRVAGSPRITKSRARSTPKAKPAAVSLVNRRMRSRLRTRLAPAPKVKEELVPQPAKRRGRPPRAAAQAPSPKKATSHRGPQTAVTKPAAPRKKRGITVLEVPDKFVALVTQYLHELQDADADLEPGEDGAADDISAESEIDADAVAAAAEEELPEITEENVPLTSATATGDDENASIVGEQIQIHDAVDADPVADMVEEAEVMDDIVSDILAHGDERVEEQPTEPSAEVEIETNIQEVVHIEQGSNQPAAFEEDVETQEDGPASIFDEEVDSYIREPVSRYSAGAIFG